MLSVADYKLVQTVTVLVVLFVPRLQVILNDIEGFLDKLGCVLVLKKDVKVALEDLEVATQVGFLELLPLDYGL